MNSWRSLGTIAHDVVDDLGRQAIADWKEVEQLDIPALVVGNEPDPTHPLEFAKAWAVHLPQGRLIQIPSKIESIENHTLSFQKHLTDFLKSIS